MNIWPFGFMSWLQISVTYLLALLMSLSMILLNLPWWTYIVMTLIVVPSAMKWVRSLEERSGKR